MDNNYFLCVLPRPYRSYVFQVIVCLCARTIIYDGALCNSSTYQFISTIFSPEALEQMYNRTGLHGAHVCIIILSENQNVISPVGFHYWTNRIVFSFRRKPKIKPISWTVFYASGLCKYFRIIYEYNSIYT